VSFLPTANRVWYPTALGDDIVILSEDPPVSFRHFLILLRLPTLHNLVVLAFIHAVRFARLLLRKVNTSTHTLPKEQLWFQFIHVNAGGKLHSIVLVSPLEVEHVLEFVAVAHLASFYRVKTHVVRFDTTSLFIFNASQLFFCQSDRLFGLLLFLLLLT